VIVMAHPLAERRVRIPSMVVCRTCSNEVQVGTLRSLHPPLDVQLMPAALNWLVAWAWVRNVAALAGAAKASTSAAVNAVISAVARVMGLDKTPPCVESDVPGRIEDMWHADVRGHIRSAIASVFGRAPG